MLWYKLKGFSLLATFEISQVHFWRFLRKSSNKGAFISAFPWAGSAQTVAIFCSQNISKPEAERGGQGPAEKIFNDVINESLGLISRGRFTGGWEMHSREPQTRREMLAAENKIFRQIWLVEKKREIWGWDESGAHWSKSSESKMIGLHEKSRDD